MHRPTFAHIDMIRVLPRILLLTAALFTPMIAMQSVQAGSTGSVIIEDTHKPAGGIGLVLVTSIRRL